MLRDKETDKYMEARFGKPDYTKSFIKEGRVWTPMSKYKLWRIDSFDIVGDLLEATK